MNHFGKLTTRMHDFREDLLNAKPMVCVEHIKRPWPCSYAC